MVSGDYYLGFDQNIIELAGYIFKSRLGSYHDKIKNSDTFSRALRQLHVFTMSFDLLMCLLDYSE